MQVLPFFVILLQIFKWQKKKRKESVSEWVRETARGGMLERVGWKKNHFKRLHYEIEDVNKTIAERERESEKKERKKRDWSQGTWKKRLASSEEAESTRLHTLENIKNKRIQTKDMAKKIEYWLNKREIIPLHTKKKTRTKKTLKQENPFLLRSLSILFIYVQRS